MTTTPTPEDTRALAQQARSARTARIRQLRRRAIATACATFVLATGVVAWNGSMGAESASSAASTTAASGSVLVEQSVESDTPDRWRDVTESTDSSDSESSAASPADVVTTQQS